jgi:S1-C subfamily serine protease
VVDNPVVRAAAPSVVRILGAACGLGISGSGWVAAPGIVVTAAHVVAGEERTYVVQSQSDRRLIAHAIAFDSKNDVAVLRVPGLTARPLPTADPENGASVAIVGYPLNGPLDSEPGRVVRHGNSGGPAIDTQGRVQLTVFAAQVGGDGGYGIPTGTVQQVLAGATGPVSTGECAP